MKVKQLIESDVANIEKEWGQKAKEKIKVEIVDGAYYGFGSELATLRLYRRYGGASNTDAGFSKNTNSFYFKLEPKH